MNAAHVSSSADDWFLHAHLAQTMDERLAAVRSAPQTILLAGADGNHSYGCLKARYPQARFEEYDSRADYLQAAQTIRAAQQSLWQKIRGRQPEQHNTDTLPENGAADMVWGNLALLHRADRAAAFANWSAALRPDGLLFFTHLGPDTLKEILALWRENGVAVTAPAWADMHDLGDLLPPSGFYDPVTDMSRLTLQYTQAQRFVRDMQTAGIWGCLNFADEAQAVRVLETAWQGGAVHDVTLELIYGHAVKKAVLPENTSVVQFYPKRPTPPSAGS